MVRKRGDRLYKDEYLRGWVAFMCPDHGFLLTGPSDAEVRCGERNKIGRKCNKIANKSSGTYGES